MYICILPCIHTNVYTYISSKQIPKKNLHMQNKRHVQKTWRSTQMICKAWNQTHIYKRVNEQTTVHSHKHQNEYTIVICNAMVEY